MSPFHTRLLQGWFWFVKLSEMIPKITNSYFQCTDDKFLCDIQSDGSSTSLSILQFCNGIDDCNDGHDEDPFYCDVWVSEIICHCMWSSVAHMYTDAYLKRHNIAANISSVMCNLLQCKGDSCDGGKTCLSDDQLCDGNNDCTDGYDENWCAEVLFNLVKNTVPTSMVHIKQCYIAVFLNFSLLNIFQKKYTSDLTTFESGKTNVINMYCTFSVLRINSVFSVC